MIVSLFSLCRLRIMTQLRSGAVDKMAGIFTKRTWQPCICQPNDLKLKKKTAGVKRGAKQKSGRDMAHPGPPLESPLWPVRGSSCRNNTGQFRQRTMGITLKSCYVQQTDSSVKNCILCNLTAKQIYQQDFKQLSALFYVTVEVLAVPWQG